MAGSPPRNGADIPPPRPGTRGPAGREWMHQGRSRMQQLGPSLPCPRRRERGLSLPEVLVASAILATTVVSSLQLTGSSLHGMGHSKLRGQVDSAIAARMEDLRGHAFSYLCRSGTDSDHPQPGGCTDANLTQELDYGELPNRANLKALCSSNGLGAGLLAFVTSSHGSDVAPFVVPSTTPAVTVTPSFTVEGNRLNVTFDAPSVPMSVSSTLVPQAQGWCP